MTKYIKKQDGFTLIEIMVSMVISSLVISGVYGVYTIQQRSYTVQEQVSEMQQRSRAAVDFMSREMRMAGYDPPPPYDQSGACDLDNLTNQPIIQADAQNFAFRYCNVQVNKSTDPTAAKTYAASLVTSSYGLYDAYGDNNGIPDAIGLTRDNAVSPMPVAEGVDAVEFQYLGQGGTVLSAPVDRIAIRAVQISMLVRSTYPDPKYTNTTVYKPASVIEAEKNKQNAPVWDINGDNEAGTGNPPNDNFHRRLLITTIYLRNMMGVQK